MVDENVYRLRVISWADFQKGIAELWKSDDPDTIPIINNPFRIIQYGVEEMRDRICFFPCAIVDQDENIACYTSIYNISDTTLRVRGIWVHPSYRGRGVGHKAWQMATTLFPPSFNRVVGFWREDSAPRFIEHSGMKIVPGTDWFWSDYSGVNMRMLYLDRGPKPGDYGTGLNRSFIEESLDEFGFGGRNNLNRTWTDAEWLEFAQADALSYEDKGIDLSF